MCQNIPCKKNIMCECEWIERILAALKDQRKYLTRQRRTGQKCEPIIIIHGLPDDAELPNNNYVDILNTIKNTAIAGYQELQKGKSALDVATLKLTQLDGSKSRNVPATVQNSILMDNSGGVCCISTLTALDHPIIFAQTLSTESHDAIIIQQIIKGRTEKNLNDSEEPDVFSNDIFSYGVIVRDRKTNLAGGRSTWTFNNNLTPSINAAASVPGCGLFVNENLCCSVSGDDQVIYVHAPARKIIRKFEKNLSDIPVLKKEVNYFMEHELQAPVAVVLLGINDYQPLMVCKSKYFPWAYCHRGVLYYGCMKEELFAEDIEMEMPPDCQCKV